ncbi:TKL protein kinase [Phytophthora cinnamomi]|uniref:TKL protein kinase n=1 Tax=Phytophthora cinnamomi TaxID=4785 RepID=UPI00355A2773|nr:TKL protein kinase [Phytophthora cinnamomi]
MIGGISVRRIPSPTFKLKIETNLDADGNCTRSGCTRRSPCGGILEDLVVASTRMPREEVDLCVVLEFVDGGDLRSLLDQYIESGYSVGFDRKMVTIALHLHSPAPAIVHRDFK